MIFKLEWCNATCFFTENFLKNIYEDIEILEKSKTKDKNKGDSR